MGKSCNDMYQILRWQTLLLDIAKKITKKRKQKVALLVSDIAVAKPRYQMLRDNIKTGRRRQVSRKWASGTRHYVALVALVPIVALRSTCSTVALVCSTSSTSSTVAPTSWMQSTRRADIPQIRKWASGIIWDLGNEL